MRLLTPAQLRARLATAGSSSIGATVIGGLRLTLFRNKSQKLTSSARAIAERGERQGARETMSIKETTRSGILRSLRMVTMIAAIASFLPQALCSTSLLTPAVRPVHCKFQLMIVFLAQVFVVRG